MALLLVGPVAILLAWLQARRRYRGHGIVEALVLLPLVLPPSVVGYLLIVVWGRHGLLGGWLEETLGLRLVFTESAAVIAAAVAALPLIVKTVQPAIALVPRELEQVAWTLGLGRWRTFARVTLPCAGPAVLAGLVLGFARALGEFGATLMFAGNIPGRTNTMSLEIYTAWQGGDDARAFFYVVVLTGISCGVVLVAGALHGRGRA